MPIDDLQSAAQKLAQFLTNLNKLGGMRLKYRIFADDSTPTCLQVELSGPDESLLTQHNGELLGALETVAAQILRLDQREQDLISFDAGNFKALHAEQQKMAATIAAEKVIESGIPYAFPPMNSRERRELHMAFRDIVGVETVSHGEGRDRFLAVFPAGQTDLPVKAPAARPSYGSRGGDRRDDRRGGRGDRRGPRRDGRR